MHITVSKWGNSLAVRIPIEIARELNLVDGSQVECSISASGSIELTPPRKQADSDWVKAHFDAVNKRLSDVKVTTPTHVLLKENERY
jgi:antitoxin MazE